MLSSFLHHSLTHTHRHFSQLCIIGCVCVCINGVLHLLRFGQKVKNRIINSSLFISAEGTTYHLTVCERVVCVGVAVRAERIFNCALRWLVINHHVLWHL